ncbi:MAG: glycosyltransferase family 2 protein [Anaerotruncus sp.]|nr:glycosyltransferase family 2 protein [Anaerotruncus sp.]
MQDAKRPLLSIFVSVYNLENYIEECLDSILQQPFQDYEILLFDNGSIDRSIEICTGYAQRYPDKIRYYKLPLPTVVGRPHHLACTRMRGRYFMQIDGDDYLASGALQQISDAILKHRPDIVTGRC